MDSCPVCPDVLLPSGPGMTLTPSDRGARFIIEFSLYWDYDIQHMYDLEHIWVFATGDMLCPTEELLALIPSFVNESIQKLPQ